MQKNSKCHLKFSTTINVFPQHSVYVQLPAQVPEKKAHEDYFRWHL